jgi:hypothetical protein
VKEESGVAYIKMIDPPEATGELAKVYQNL